MKIEVDREALERWHKCLSPMFNPETRAEIDAILNPPAPPDDFMKRWRDRIGEIIPPSGKPWSCFPDTAKETEAMPNPPAPPASAAELVRDFMENWHECSGKDREPRYVSMTADLAARIDRHTDDAMRDALRMCDARHKAIERQLDDAERENERLLSLIDIDVRESMAQHVERVTLRAEVDAMRAVVAAASTWCGWTDDPPAVRDFGAAGELVWSVYRYRKAMAKGKA